ncbi:MAG: hypothetical protein JW700_00830 [Candidatus Aenigmarchaeota archaeon]|nr:hypothetical protein [Candidatus Aenigmarchaeota archaeon]
MTQQLQKARKETLTSLNISYDNDFNKNRQVYDDKIENLRLKTSCPVISKRYGHDVPGSCIGPSYCRSNISNCKMLNFCKNNL